MAITDGDIKKLKTIFATKNEVREIVRDEIDKALDEKLDQKFFDFKSQIFDHIDGLAKGFRDTDENVAVLSYRV